MEILGAAIGLGVGALIVLLSPILGLTILIWLLSRRTTWRMGLVVATLAGFSIFALAQRLQWHPDQTAYDRAFFLTAYFLVAVIPWSLLAYLAYRVRKAVTNAA
jgi:hypothetical protein